MTNSNIIDIKKDIEELKQEIKYIKEYVENLVKSVEQLGKISTTSNKECPFCSIGINGYTDIRRTCLL